MTLAATIPQAKTASLDALYALIHDDLRRVDALILQRVRGEVQLIHDIAQHIVASGGKRIRPALTLISAQLCGYEGERHIPLAAAVEFIHTATLLHDDVVDASTLRRGQPTANEAFGNKASVLVGDFLLSQAFQLMVADVSPRVPRILADASAVIAKGEVMQMMTEGDPQTGIDQYLQVISSKTAMLFAAACELGAVVAGTQDAEEALREFGIYIGIAFQLVDDALDYNAEEARLGKTVGDDFREGKITLPVILAYSAGAKEEQDFWQRTLGERQQRAGDLETALALMERHQSLVQTAAMAARYCEKARRCLAPFPNSAARGAMLDIADFCASRAY